MVPSRVRAPGALEPRQNTHSKRKRANKDISHSGQRKRKGTRELTIQCATSSTSGQDSDEIWADQAFFAIEHPQTDIYALIDPTFLSEFIEPDPSRGAWELDIAAITDSLNNQAQNVLITNILYPNIPEVALREVNYHLLNPFAEGSIDRYSKPRLIVATTKEGEVNGYIKFRLQQTHTGFEDASGLFDRRVFGLRQGQFPSMRWQTPLAVVPLLPPNFGRNLKLDTNDQKLLTFYLTAYCRGRTLIPMHNFWLTEIAPMAESYPIVQEALLALAGSYILDYVHSESLRQRTNRHYAEACKLISEALVAPDSHAVGKSDPLVAALILMEADDEVIWELRRPKTEIPNFHRGNLLARTILDHSDPGYRYWESRNIQYTRSWAGMSACVAVGCILAEMMSPLLPSNASDRNYAWLLGGRRREAHTIYGAKGFSPKLIHTLAQITRLSAELKEDNQSVIIPMAAAQIKSILDRFRQRSPLSEGYATLTALLESCELQDGKVQTPTKITELSGEAWLCATKIYLHCRLFRKPPSHPDVRQSLEGLMQCIKRLPESGPLLTAQSPFFPVFLMAIVSYTPEDRSVATKWFTAVVSGAGRSNVPPIWDAVQLLWVWLDKNVNGPHAEAFDESVLLGQRKNWWEEMVEYLIGKVGWMSLT